MFSCFFLPWQVGFSPDQLPWWLQLSSWSPFKEYSWSHLKEHWELKTGSWLEQLIWPCSRASRSGHLTAVGRRQNTNTFFFSCNTTQPIKALLTGILSPQKLKKCGFRTCAGRCDFPPESVLSARGGVRSLQFKAQLTAEAASGIQPQFGQRLAALCDDLSFCFRKLANDG